MLNSKTFGSSPCAIKLATMLNEHNNPVLTRKVSRYLKGTNGMVKSIGLIEDGKHRRALFKMMQRSIRECEMVMPEIVKTHMQNVAQTRLKMVMRQSEDFDTTDYSHPTSAEFDFD